MLTRVRQAKQRPRETLMLELLQAMESGETKKTRLMYIVGTTISRIEYFLDDCLSAGLIYYDDKNNIKPHLTIKGKRYLELLKLQDSLLGEKILGEKS